MPGLNKDMPFGKEDTKQLIVHKGRSANDSFDSIWYIITIKPRCYWRKPSSHQPVHVTLTIGKTHFNLQLLKCLWFGCLPAPGWSFYIRSFLTSIWKGMNHLNVNWKLMKVEFLYLWWVCLSRLMDINAVEINRRGELIHACKWWYNDAARFHTHTHFYGGICMYKKYTLYTYLNYNIWYMHLYFPTVWNNYVISLDPNSREMNHNGTLIRLKPHLHDPSTHALSIAGNLEGKLVKVVDDGK